MTALDLEPAASPAGYRETDPLRVETDTSWMAHANCRGIRTDLFFPPVHAKAVAIQAARAVCNGCPVRQPCLDYALDHSIKFGLWGGLSEKQRRAMRVARRVS